MSDTFELFAARFVSMVALSLPKELKSVVFSSPLSARSPDLCMLWHSGYREGHKLKLFSEYALRVTLSFAKVLLNICRRINPFAYALYGKVDSTLLIVPSICVKETSDADYTTDYLKKEKEDAVFIFGQPKTCGKNEMVIRGLSIQDKFYFTLALVKAGIGVYFRLRGEFFDSTLLLFNWLVWSLRLNWLRDYYLENMLSEVIEKYNIRKIGCLHEMHAYSRVIWRVAAKYKLNSYTVQHAVIAPGKRWYFCYTEERQAGLMLPSVMYMYNKNIIETLRPYFNGTIFKLGCSSRYAHWKDIQKSNNIGKYYLFVGALASFDNKILLTSLKRLLGDSFKTPLPIKVRLHPFAILSRTLRRWLALNARVGRIELSRNINLKDDLNNATVVIGMSTTVLEEALLLGKPVIQLTHPDFLKYIDISGVQGAREVEYNRLSMQELDSMSEIEVDSEAIRMKLGLNEPEVTYQQLFL